MTEVTMSTIITEIGTFFTQSVSWLGDVLDVITGSPVLLILCVAMPVIGFSVGLLNRLIKM